MKKLVYSIIFLTSNFFSLIGGSGIWEYYLNTTAGNFTNFNGANLGNSVNLNTDQLDLTLSGIKTWQSNPDNVIGGTFHYRVFKEGENPSFASLTLNYLTEWQNGGSLNKEWNNNTSINLLDGLSEIGTYTVQIFFTAAGQAGGNFTLYNPSEGTSHSATFTVTTALPVVFSSINVSSKHNKNEITWIVSSESNHSHYEIERSENGQDWTNIGKVSDNLSRSSRKYYEFVDHFPLKGRNYYRIKQIDIDGTFAYSEIRFINLNPEENKLLVFPNPSFDKFIKIEYASKFNPAQKLFIYNVTGQKMHEKNLDSDQVNEYINFSDKNPGIYLISIIDQQGKALQSQKVIIH